MIRRLILPILLASYCALAQQVKTDNPPPTPAQLEAATARGRMLAEYDVAAWHATDAVEALKPDHRAAPLYVARKVGGKWEVVFGRMGSERDRFLIVYRASQGAAPQEFSIKKSDPPLEDRGFYFQASKAIETTSKDFGNPGGPYNRYVLPTADGQLYVYFLPGQTAEQVYPLGGDVRYTVTLDGSTIVDQRQMHRTVNQNNSALSPGQQLAAGTHNHVLNNDIEDSDVFHVLTRSPSIPEYVGTPDKHLYEIQTDGSIKRVR